MFEKLKEKLGGFKKAIGTVLERKENEATEAAKVETAKVETVKAEIKGDIETDLKTQVTSSKIEEVKKTPEPVPKAPAKFGILDKIKAAVFEQEFIIDESIKLELVGTRRKIGSDAGKIVEDALKKAILKVISVDYFDFDEFIKKANKPVSIVFVGVNGTGKTTTVAKMAERFKSQNYSVVIAAGDTFRAGAIEQIDRHAQALEIKIIKHQEGSDPAAIIYDAIQFAKAKHKDIVLADTAGRMHININLMDQLKKICRVNNPDLIIFVDEAIAGNDAVERAKLFNSAVPFSGSILTKADADSKGGAAISISYTTGKPILFLGVGQTYKDLIKFEPQWLIARLFE